MMPDDKYYEMLENVKRRLLDRKFDKIDSAFYGVRIEEIAGEDLIKTVSSQINIALGLVGVPLYCKLEPDTRGNPVFKMTNFRNDFCVGKRFWHLPQRLSQRKYSFYVVWIDGITEHKDFHAQDSLPVVLSSLS